MLVDTNVIIESHRTGTWSALSSGYNLDDGIKVALEQRGVELLYRHQAEAITSALEGKNVVLQAPTANEKTLAFQIPMISSSS